MGSLTPSCVQGVNVVVSIAAYRSSNLGLGRGVAGKRRRMPRTRLRQPRLSLPRPARCDPRCDQVLIFSVPRLIRGFAWD